MELWRVLPGTMLWRGQSATRSPTPDLFGVEDSSGEEGVLRVQLLASWTTWKGSTALRDVRNRLGCRLLVGAAQVERDRLKLRSPLGSELVVEGLQGPDVPALLGPHHRAVALVVGDDGEKAVGLRLQPPARRRSSTTSSV